MTLFILFLFLFSIFFTFDNKPINLLLDFIGIILSISFYLILSSPSIDLSFFSFIFIIIYGSALAILFAFIIMLFNNNYYDKAFSTSNPSISSFFPLKFLFNSFNINFSHSFFFSFIKLYFIPILLFFLFFIFFYFFYTFYFFNLNNFNFLFFEKKSFFLQYLVNFIFSSFIFNHIPLILIINILLLGLIGAVFLLI